MPVNRILRDIAADAAAEPESDEALMLRLQGGDETAFNELLDRHLKPVAGFAYRMLGDAAEAYDVAQETFLRLWRFRAAWQPRAQLRAWLLRVARNLCVDRFRRREVVTDRMPEEIDLRIGPSGELQRKEAATLVGDALAGLPERQRAAIALVYYEGHSNTEAAKVLGVSVDALESLLARARRGMRRHLGSLRPYLVGE